MKNSDTCTAAVVLCDELILGPPGGTPTCVNSLAVSCDDSQLYSDSFVPLLTATNELIQGITSQANPTPPSIDLTLATPAPTPPFDAAAALNTSFGSFDGTCHVVEVYTP